VQRLTISIDDDLGADLDRMQTGGYHNRSEALRDLARVALQPPTVEVAGPRPCVVALTYIFLKRLTHDFQERDDPGQATPHTHIDHDSCTTCEP